MTTDYRARIQLKHVRDSRRILLVRGFVGGVLPIRHRFCGKGLENVWYSLLGIVTRMARRNRRELFGLLRRLADLDAILSLSSENDRLLARYVSHRYSKSERQLLIQSYPFGREVVDWGRVSRRLKNIIKRGAGEKAYAAAWSRIGRGLELSVPSLLETSVFTAFRRFV